MLMKDVVHNLPRPIDFEEREQVSEAAAVPVIEFQPDPSNRVDDVDTDDPGVEPCGWGIVVHVVKEELDRASKELPIGIAEDGRLLVEGGLHICTAARFGTIDIMLNRLGNRLILAEVGTRVTHGALSSSQCRVPGSLSARRAPEVQPNASLQLLPEAAAKRRL